MSLKCTTHFNACDCREEKFGEMEKELEKLRAERVVMVGALERVAGLADCKDKDVTNHCAYVAHQALKQIGEIE